MATSTVSTRAGRAWRALVTCLLAACVGLATTAAGPLPEREEHFLEALRSSATYHRALANLPAKHFDQPETATYEFERLTVDAIEAQFVVTVGPCFARWWAYEYMGLELTALSLELRRSHAGYAETADALERLGARMWANAMALLPHAASACGIEPRPGMPITREPAGPS
jgi:hypothetical protein